MLKTLLISSLLVGSLLSPVWSSEGKVEQVEIRFCLKDKGRVALLLEQNNISFNYKRQLAVSLPLIISKRDLDKTKEVLGRDSFVLHKDGVYCRYWLKTVDRFF